MLGVVVVLSGVLALAATGSVNYCGAKMCGNTNAHTFCRYPEGPSPKCVGYTAARLRSEDKIRLLSRFNRYRNVAASGAMRGYPPAGDMLKLRWVEELAREAQRWADQCRPPRSIEEHDKCRDLYSTPVGQCVASVVGQPPLSQVENMVDIWYTQGKLYNDNVTFYVPPRKEDGKYYGDFAQIMWAKSYMVGCGHSRFMVLWQGRLQSVERLVCNIAPYGPQPTRPLWTVAPPTVFCPSRSIKSPVWHSLCDYKRTQNATMSLDPSTTLEDHLLLNTVLEIEGNDTLNYFGSLDEIYLNKLAIATLVNMLTTQKYFDSMQKSEIIAFVDVIEFQSNETTIEIVPQLLTPQNSRFGQNTLMTTANTSLSLQTETTTATQTKLEPNFTKMTKNIKSGKKKLKKRKRFNEKIKLNNMTKSHDDLADDILNDARGSSFTENLSEKIQNVQPCDYFAEGACLDEIQSAADEFEAANTEDHNFTVAPEPLLNDVTDERHITSRRHFGLFDIQMYDMLDDQSFSGSGDDGDIRKQNTTTTTTTEDPESVRQRQEALERIENEMYPIDEKIRQNMQKNLEELEATSREYAETPSNESESVDLVLNVLKLIPSWTENPGEENSNIASCAKPSLVIVLAFCFY